MSSGFTAIDRVWDSASAYQRIRFEDRSEFDGDDEVGPSFRLAATD